MGLRDGAQFLANEPQLAVAFDRFSEEDARQDDGRERNLLEN